MHASVSAALGFLFVLLGGVNVWLMLAGKRSSRHTIRIHRTAGYLFIAIYAVMFCFMALRLKDISDDLTPRLAIHISLALVLLPLLIAKVLIARHQKALAGVLRALGIAIFAISFTLIALNVLPLAEQHITTRTISPLALVTIVACVCAGLGVLLRRRPAPVADNIANIPESANTLHKETSRKRIPLKLARVQAQTHDSTTLRFLVPREHKFFAHAGQFLNFYWVIDGTPIVRSYSICSSPTQSGYIEITSKRTPNGRVSNFLNDQALPGLEVQAEGPYGNFYFDEQKHKRIMLIAGGSGITPMISMLRYVDDLCLPLEVMLIYCVRTEEDVMFEADLFELACRLENFRYVLVLSQAGPGWKGLRGHLTREIIENQLSNPQTATFFLCGPPPMMASCLQLLGSLGVSSSNIKQENFGPPLGTAPPPSLAGGLFEADFTRSGKTCHISRLQTVLQAAEANGVAIPFGCRQGECGSCTSKLVAGEVEMTREEGLPAELKEQGYILPCVSHARSDITLDV